jgi:hypothetical protein
MYLEKKTQKNNTTKLIIRLKDRLPHLWSPSKSILWVALLATATANMFQGTANRRKSLYIYG